MWRLTINVDGHKFQGAEFIPVGEPGHPFIDSGYRLEEAKRAGVKRPVAGIIMGRGQWWELMATFSAEDLLVEPATLGNMPRRDSTGALASELGWTPAEVEGAAQDLLGELGWDDVDWQDSRTGEIHPGLARRLREREAQRVEDATNGDDSCRRGDEDDW